jgi:hypothetical protein
VPDINAIYLLALLPPTIVQMDISLLVMLKKVRVLEEISYFEVSEIHII